MAYATHKFPQQVGNTSGEAGARAFEVFTVYTDTLQQNAHDVIANGPITVDPWGRTAIPRKSKHPSPNLRQLEMQEYYTLDNPAPGVFEVLLTYERPRRAGTYNGWLMDVVWQQRTEPLAMGIGRILASGTVDETQLGDIIGPMMFRRMESQQGASHRTVNPQNESVLYLRAAGAQIISGRDGVIVLKPYRFVEAFERIGVQMVMRFSRKLTTIRFSHLRFLTRSGAKVNKEVWGGFPKKTLLFLPESLREERTVNAFNTEVSEFDISVLMLENPKGWTPYTAAEVFQDPETGSKLEVQPILGPGLVQTSTWPVYSEVDFETLFSTIEAPKIKEQVGSVTPIPIP